MRILHTSDWHLGRIFCGVHLTGEQEYVLEALTDAIRSAKPDVLVVAGDVYDRAVPPVEAVNLLDDMLHRVVFGMKLPVIMISGNHDSADRLGFGSRFFTGAGLHVFGQVAAQPGWVELEDRFGPVRFLPLPYADVPYVRDRLGDEAITSDEAAMAALIARAQLPQGRNVAVGHCFVSGGEASESERPLSIGGTALVPAHVFSPFQYTALGHLHRPQAVAPNVLYSGSLMKYSFAEANHEKAAYLVEMNAAGECAVERIPLKPRRDLRCVRGSLEQIIRGAETDPAREDYIKATLTDEGALFDAMGQLRRAYPNALQIEREFIAAAEGKSALTGDFHQYTDFELFCDFYAQATGKALGEDYLPTLRAVLEEVRQSREEGTR